MSDSGSGPRERGGSFCQPSERGNGSGTGGEEDIRELASRKEQKKVLDISSKVEQSSGRPTQKVEPQLAVSRRDLSNPHRMPAKTATTLDVTSQAMSRSSTPSARSANPEPPVTRGTLAELDVPRIVQNPKLRHDVNFDPDLHFRPNLDGEKGKKKLQRANQFWSVLKNELRAFMEDPITFAQQHPGTDWCLPTTLRSIGDILETLVPPEDRKAVAEIMNVELLMQQFAKQVADLESLATWLAKTLKMHCAPMRDDWVNEMVLQLSTGNQNRDVEMLAAGLQTLLGVLEAMKLVSTHNISLLADGITDNLQDVANHQIRCLRPLLIQDTIDFEQTFFMKKIAASKVDVTYAHRWFRAATRLPDTTNFDPSEAQIWSFFKGFTNCLLPTHSNEGIPDVFMFDEERIIKLRVEMLDVINMEVCIGLFRKVHAKARSEEDRTQQNPTANQREPSYEISPTTGEFPGSLSSPTIPNLPDFHARVQASSNGAVRGRFRRSMVTDHQTFEPFASPSPMSPSSSISSPYSSRSASPQSFPERLSSQPSDLQFQNSSLLPSKGQEAKLIEELNAILTDISSISATNGSQSGTHTHRWTMASSQLALQILHATGHPMASYSTLLPYLEQVLMSALSTPSSHLFQEAEQLVLRSMSPMLAHLVSNFGPLNNTRLFEIAVLPRGKAALHKLLKDGAALCIDETARRVVERMEVLEVVRGMAHVGVLHWKVWGPLVYQVDPDTSSTYSGESPEVVSTAQLRDSKVQGDIPTSSLERDPTRDERERRRRSLKRRSLGR